MTEDQVRTLLLAQAAKLKTKRLGSTGLAQWNKLHGLSKSHTHEFLHGNRGPSPSMLNALGLEWRIVRKPREPKP